MSKVSVVVPVYNVKEYIKECLSSIQNQTYKDLEILCIDDCGTDNSIKIAEEIAQKDNRIKIIRHEHNKGLGGARNTGLDNASGEFIFFIDSDDFIEKDCISVVTDKLEETGLNTVFFKADVYWQNTGNRTKIWYDNYANFPEGMFCITGNNMCTLPHYSWNKGYKRSFLIKNNIKWQENVIYEDIEFFFKIFINSPATYMIDRSFYIYRRRDDSIIGQCYVNTTHAEDLYKITLRIKQYLVENNLMKQYHNAFLQLLVNNLNNYREFPEIHKKLTPLMVSCLKDLKFPEEFEVYKYE